MPPSGRGSPTSARAAVDHLGRPLAAVDHLGRKIKTTVSKAAAAAAKAEAERRAALAAEAEAAAAEQAAQEKEICTHVVGMLTVAIEFVGTAWTSGILVQLVMVSYVALWYSTDWLVGVLARRAAREEWEAAFSDRVPPAPPPPPAIPSALDGVTASTIAFAENRPILYLIIDASVAIAIGAFFFFLQDIEQGIEQWRQAMRKAKIDSSSSSAAAQGSYKRLDDEQDDELADAEVGGAAGARAAEQRTEEGDPGDLILEMGSKSKSKTATELRLELRLVCDKVEELEIKVKVHKKTKIPIH